MRRTVSNIATYFSKKHCWIPRFYMFNELKTKHEEFHKKQKLFHSTGTPVESSGTLLNNLGIPRNNLGIPRNNLGPTWNKLGSPLNNLWTWKIFWSTAPVGRLDNIFWYTLYNILDFIVRWAVQKEEEDDFDQGYLELRFTYILLWLIRTAPELDLKRKRDAWFWPIRVLKSIWAVGLLLFLN